MAVWRPNGDSGLQPYGLSQNFSTAESLESVSFPPPSLFSPAAPSGPVYVNQLTGDQATFTATDTWNTHAGVGNFTPAWNSDSGNGASRITVTTTGTWGRSSHTTAEAKVPV